MCEEEDNYVFGQLVFAKICGYRPWPAKITRVDENEFEVVFYGTKDTAILQTKDLELYNQETCKKQMKVNSQKKKTSFLKAMKEIAKEQSTTDKSLYNEGGIPISQLNLSENEKNRICPLSGRPLPIKHEVQAYVDSKPQIYRDPMKLSFLVKQRDLLTQMRKINATLGSKNQNLVEGLMVLEEIKKNIRDVQPLMILKYPSVMINLEQLSRFATQSHDVKTIHMSHKIKTTSRQIYEKLLRLFSNGFKVEQPQFMDKFRHLSLADVFEATTVEDLQHLSNDTAQGEDLDADTLKNDPAFPMGETESEVFD